MSRCISPIPLLCSLLHPHFQMEHHTDVLCICFVLSATDVTLTCSLPHDVGTNYTVMVQNYVPMSIPQQEIGMTTSQFGYSAPSISTISYASANTAGGDLLTVIGNKWVVMFLGLLCCCCCLVCLVWFVFSLSSHLLTSIWLIKVSYFHELNIHSHSLGSSQGVVTVAGNICNIGTGQQTDTQIICSIPPGQGTAQPAYVIVSCTHQDRWNGIVRLDFD